MKCAFVVFVPLRDLLQYYWECGMDYIEVRHDILKMLFYNVRPTSHKNNGQLYLLAQMFFGMQI